MSGRDDRGGFDPGGAARGDAVGEEPLAVLLATHHAELAEAVTDLAREAGTFRVAQVVHDSVALGAALEVQDVDVVAIDAGIGPLSAPDVARDLTQRHPDTALVLLTEHPDQGVLERALHAGFRGVVAVPVGLEDLSAKVDAAGRWSRRLRDRLAESPEDRRGRMIVLAGAKGGVGTTTLAVRLALEAQRSNPDRRICLVDADLQAGDVRTLLDLSHHRSVDDLVEVAHEVTARHLADALYAHPSGLRILLPPPQGEHERDVTAEVARGVLGAIRTRFDLVVADVGSVLTEGGAMATELADEVILVVTPDVLSLRAASRLVQLWERRRHRKDGITVLVNRASRDTEVQPDLVGRVLGLPVMRATVPAAFRDLEPAVNSGVGEDTGEGPVGQGVLEVARELQLVRPKRRRSLFGRAGDERGQATVEGLAVLPAALALLLLGWQLVLVGWTYTQGLHAVREGARALAVHEAVEPVVRAELPSSMHEGLEVSSTATAVTARVGVPLLAPGWMTPLTVTVQQGTVPEPELR